MKKKVFLVTNSIKSTLSNTKKFETLLAGEWCNVNFKDKSLKKNKFIILPFHWDNEIKKYKDSKYLIKVYKSSLKKLSKHLNMVHKKKFSEKYWEIILSPWLCEFVISIFDKYSTVKKIKKNYDILSTKLIKYKNEEQLIPKDINVARDNFDSEYWNHFIFSFLLKRILKIKKITYISKIAKKEKNISARQVKNKIDFFKDKIMKIFEILTKPFFKLNNGIFVINSYLGFFGEIFLNFKLNNFVGINRKINLMKDFKVNKNLRKSKISKMNRDEFTKILSYLIPMNIPKVYLEGFIEMNNYASVLPWPKKPRAIFTSNNHYSDELFKFWVADKIEKYSTPFIFGQHGGGYFLGNYSISKDIEVNRSTKFIAWGKNKTSKKVSGLFNFKTQFKKYDHNTEGKINIVQYSPTSYLRFCNSGMLHFSQFKNNVKFQKRFLQNLNKKLLKKTKIRLSHSQHLKNYERETWHDDILKLELEGRKVPIKKSIEESRLLIYNDLTSTLFLETISSNIPSILFLQNYKNYIDKKYKAFFLQLEKAGIIYDNPLKLSKFINNNFKEVEKWWNSKRVQKARDSFCYNFSYISKKPIRDLSNTINNIANVTLRT